MKVSNIITAAVLLTISLVTADASAQSGFNGSIGGLPFSFNLGDGGGNQWNNGNNNQWNGGSITTQPVPFTSFETDFRGQRFRIEGIKWMVNGKPQQRILRRTRVGNSVAYDSGKRIDQTRFNPYDGTFNTDSSSTKIYESAKDVFRDHVDPGSKRYVDEMRFDRGEYVRVVGYEWRSYGKYHSDLKRISVRANGLGDTETNTERHVMAPAPRP